MSAAFPARRTRRHLPLRVSWIAAFTVAIAGSPAVARAVDTTGACVVPADTDEGAAPALAKQAGPALLAALAAGKVVDLTHAFDAETVYWPTEDGFQLEKEHAEEAPGGYYYSSNRFRTAEHGGTHTDAPIHFAEGHLTVDQLPLQSLIGPAVVVDVSAAAAKDRDARLTVEDLVKWESKHGRIPHGAIVLLRSGWSARWPDRAKVLGTAKHGDTKDLHFPGFSLEAANWLLRERDIAAIGVDTPSIDYGPSQDFVVHRAVLGANKPGFENIAQLERLPETGAVLIVLPMKIGGGTGGPARIIAVLP